jgi:type III pantothenate kinase
MLLLDAGNSRIKWALIQNGVWLYRDTVPVSDGSALRRSLAPLPPPGRILVSNVAGEAVAQIIRSACAVWNCKVEFIVAQAEQCGVRNSYGQPGQLGSDRWAALIAAWQQMRATCLVVNCGTATTVDALSGSGEFLGGLIIPGLEMMQNSLAAGTAQLTRSGGNWKEFPRNTADAIFSGSVKATVGAILQQHALLGTPKASCLVGGGAAELIRPHLGLPLQNGDDLVLRGLQLIGQESGKPK